MMTGRTKFCMWRELINGVCVNSQYNVASISCQLKLFDTGEMFSQENRQNTKILGVRPFRMIPKWPPTVTRRAKH